MALDKYKLQNAIGTIAEYFKSWKISICAEKTEVLPIVGSCRDTSQRLRKQCREVRFSINNLQIEPVSKAKYLGVVFAKNALFDRHIDHVIAKTNTAMALSRCIINRRSISNSVRRLVYKYIINPIVTYASQIWLNPSFISSHHAANASESLNANVFDQHLIFISTATELNMSILRGCTIGLEIN